MNLIMKLIIGALTLMVVIATINFCCSVKREVHVNQTREVDQKRSVETAVDRKVNIKTAGSWNEMSPGEWVKGQTTFPDAQWTLANPAHLGWNTETLDQAKEFYEQLNADACMVVQHGYVVAAWGNISEPIQTRSMRKSFLGTLYGVYYQRGMISLDETLLSIGIDEKEGLTDVEKTATVKDLLASRSGIFLPAAYDPNDHPPRGKYKPNEVWSYNNWDFNALATIFEKKTQQKIFESFEAEVARPLQMQDFRLENTEYRYEDVSLHPAYLFSTSARDDARMGLLWLNKGKWKDQQLLSAEWMEKSTSMVTDFKGKSGLSLRDGYGYLFWVDTNAKGEWCGYSALGISGQYIYVNPANDLVIVFRADPGSIFRKWMGLRVQPEESYALVDKILAAAPKPL